MFSLQQPSLQSRFRRLSGLFQGKQNIYTCKRVFILWKYKVWSYLLVIFWLIFLGHDWGGKWCWWCNYIRRWLMDDCWNKQGYNEPHNCSNICSLSWANSSQLMYNREASKYIHAHANCKLSCKTQVKLCTIKKA